MLAPDTDSKGAYIIGERTRSQVERCRVKLLGEEISISVSVGIASYPLHSSGVTELIKKADEAMYNAKGLGKNQVCVFANPNNQPEHANAPQRDRRNHVKSTA